MFNYFKSLILSSQANSRANQAFAESNQELAISNEAISSAIEKNTQAKLEIAQKKLEVKNRVDISLCEYESLKSRAEKAESEVAYLRKLLEKLKLPLDDVRFNPNEIKTEWMSDPLSLGKNFIVRFKVNRSDTDYGN